MAITHIIGFRTSQELRDNTADYQEEGYTTVQLQTDDIIQVWPGTSDPWPFEAGKNWYLLIATKDAITVPEKKPGNS